MSVAAHNAYASVAQLGLSPEQRGRLASWIADIALDLRKGVPNYIGSKGELRIGNKGSLAIYPDAGWYNYEEGVWGGDAVALILHLMDASSTDARHYALQWLNAHPGHGIFTAVPISDAAQAEKDHRNAAFAAEVLGRMQPVVPGTASHAYLGCRGLLGGPLPACAAHLHTGRQHESALVGILTAADGEVVAIQLGHLLADGGKSPNLPQRNQYAIDKARAAGAMFAIPAAPLPTNGQDVPDVVRQFAGALILCEGLEDALSLHCAFPYSAIGGLPGGIGRAIHLKVPKGARILVVADGDAPNSMARKSLTKGVDSLLTAGAEVHLAMPASGEDANSLLQAGGIEAIHAVVATAVPATLSRKARLAQLLRMPWADFNLVLDAARKELKVPIDFLRGAWKALRQGEASDEEAPDEWAFLEVIPWAAPVNDIEDVCNAALDALATYVVADRDDLAVDVMWALLSHAVAHETIYLEMMPRRAIEGPDKRCGKTTRMRALSLMSARPLRLASMTAAFFYRTIELKAPSIFIDEAQDLYRRHRQDGHLLALLKSGHNREEARTGVVDTTETSRGVRALTPRAIPLFAAVAYTSIGPLPDGQLADRALVGRQQRAKAGEVKARLRHGKSPALAVVQQKFARWMGDQVELPDVPVPDAALFNRDWDNWEPVYQVATLVGGHWPATILRAALRAVDDRPPSDDGIGPLLTDIRTVFGDREQMSSAELCSQLVNLPDASAEWRQVNRGRDITPRWLARQLHEVTDPKGPQQVRIAGRNVQGYRRTQFTASFEVYSDTPPQGADSSPASPASPAPGDSAKETNDLKSQGKSPGAGDAGDAGDKNTPAPQVVPPAAAAPPNDPKQEEFW